jgi:uncharacterized protein
MNTAANRWADRVDRADWGEITCQVNEHGCALTPQLMTPAECERIARLYDSDELFRSTIDMSRYRFGEGEYRYFGRPFPDRKGRYICKSNWPGRWSRPLER